MEGSLLDLTVVEPVAFFTWNAQTFLDRTVRRSLIFLMAILRPFFYAADRKLATRVIYAVLRGITRDRLDLLGEEYFEYKLKPHLKGEGVRRLKAALALDPDLVLVSQGLDHVMRPLAKHLGLGWMLANRLEFRDGVATGRLESPVIRPRGSFARITGSSPDGSRSPQALVEELEVTLEEIQVAVRPIARPLIDLRRPVVHFGGTRQLPGFSVRQALTGRSVMLIGVTGFIGKVWLANTLRDIPEIGKIYLLIRRQKSNPAVRRFEKMVEESPVFDPLFALYGDGLGDFLRDKVEVVEGDVTGEGLGLSLIHI